MPAVMSTVRRTTSWPIAAVVPWTQTWLGISGKGPSRGAPLLTVAPLQAVQHWHPWRLSPSEYGGTGQTLPLLCIPLHEDHVTWRWKKAWGSCDLEMRQTANSFNLKKTTLLWRRFWSMSWQTFRQLVPTYQTAWVCSLIPRALMNDLGVRLEWVLIVLKIVVVNS